MPKTFKPEQYLDVLSVRLIRDFSLSSPDTEIHNPKDAVELVGGWIRSFDREVLTAIFTAPNGAVVGMHICSIGTMTESLASPAEILRCGLLCGATQFLLMHNHTGVLKPSQEDISVTDRMVRAGKLMGIELLDHIIVCNGRKGYYSIREETTVLDDVRIPVITSADEIDWDSKVRIAEQTTNHMEPVDQTLTQRSTRRHR